jgi:hypothetical protein
MEPPFIKLVRCSGEPDRVRQASRSLAPEKRKWNFYPMGLARCTILHLVVQTCTTEQATKHTSSSPAGLASQPITRLLHPPSLGQPHAAYQTRSKCITMMQSCSRVPKNQMLTKSNGQMLKARTIAKAKVL